MRLGMLLALLALFTGCTAEQWKASASRWCSHNPDCDCTDDACDPLPSERETGLGSRTQ